MKNQITRIAVVVMALFMAFGCEKKELALEEVAETNLKRFAIVTEVLNLKGDKEKALIIGTKEELNVLMKEGPTMLKRVSKRANILEPVVTGPVGPDPYDPYQACWDEIMAFYDANYEGWLAAANENCQDIWICAGCSQGLMAMDFHIKPNARKCWPLAEASLEASFSLLEFNFGDDELESDAVFEFVKTAK